MAAWSGSTRGPATGHRRWRELRLRILARDKKRCTLCGAKATQVDHIVPVSQGGTDAVSNLASICDACHAKKTAREANANRQPMRRPPERHPGLR